METSVWGSVTCQRPVFIACESKVLCSGERQAITSEVELFDIAAELPTLKLVGYIHIYIYTYIYIYIYIYLSLP